MWTAGLIRMAVLSTELPQGMIMNIAGFGGRRRRPSDKLVSIPSEVLHLPLAPAPSHALEFGFTSLVNRSAHCTLTRSRLRQAAVAVNFHGVMVIGIIRVSMKARIRVAF